jgi:hypothetical protein
MKRLLLLTGFIILSFLSYAQEKDTVVQSAKPIRIKWTNKLEGDFSFRDRWSYGMAIEVNEFGQPVCDGLCDEASYRMRDSTGRIYEDSLVAYYKLVDTTHRFHSIECETNCYEFGEATDIFVYYRYKNSYSLSTGMGISTHCLLDISISRNKCLPYIFLNSVLLKEKQHFTTQEDI